MGVPGESQTGPVDVIEIEEPPTIAACTSTMVPLVWLWSPRAAKWKSYIPVDGDLDLMRRHRCERHGDPDPSWRQLSFNDVPTRPRSSGHMPALNAYGRN